MHTNLQASQHSLYLLTPVSAYFESWTHNTQQWNRPLRTPSPAFLHSHAQIPVESIHVTLQIIYTPKAQALFLDKFTKLQTFQSSANLSLSLSKFLQQTTWLELPGVAEKVGIRPRSPSYRSFTIAMSIKILPFYLLRIHRSPQKLSSSLSDLLLLTPTKPVYSSPKTHSHIRIMPQSSRHLSNRSPTSVGFLQKPPNSTVIPSDPAISPLAVAARPS